MKRVKIALILLLITGIVCSCEFLYITKCADSITEKIEKVSEYYENGDTDYALILASAANEEWKQNEKYIDMLLYHDYVDEISAEIASFEIYIANEDLVALLSACNKAVVRLESLKKSEFPYAENII